MSAGGSCQLTGRLPLTILKHIKRQRLAVWRQLGEIVFDGTIDLVCFNMVHQLTVIRAE